MNTQMYITAFKRKNGIVTIKTVLYIFFLVTYLGDIFLVTYLSLFPVIWCVFHCIDEPQLV